MGPTAKRFSPEPLKSLVVQPVATLAPISPVKLHNTRLRSGAAAAAPRSERPTWTETKLIAEPRQRISGTGGRSLACCEYNSGAAHVHVGSITAERSPYALQALARGAKAICGIWGLETPSKAHHLSRPKVRRVLLERISFIFKDNFVENIDILII